MLETILIIISTSLLTLGLLAWYVNHTKNVFLDLDLPEILQDVGESLSTQFKEAFTNPQVSRAMSVLGKQSGEVRSNKALRNKVADNIMGQYPAMNMVLKQLDITPIEGLQLLNDPMVGPLIQGALKKGLGGITNLNNPQSSSNSGKVGYG